MAQCNILTVFCLRCILILVNRLNIAKLLQMEKQQAERRFIWKRYIAQTIGHRIGWTMLIVVWHNPILGGQSWANKMLHQNVKAAVVLVLLVVVQPDAPATIRQCKANHVVTAKQHFCDQK